MMININLIPWREARRVKRKKQFIGMIIGAVVLGGLATYGMNALFSNWVEAQRYRNNFLQNESTLLSKKIGVITQLKKEKKDILKRVEVIESLQQQRPLSVNIFNEIAKIIPEGVYILLLEKRGDVVNLVGKTDSNNQLSRFMRVINQAHWLKKANLLEIKKQDSETQRFSDFKLVIDLKDEDGADLSKGKGK